MPTLGVYLTDEEADAVKLAATEEKSISVFLASAVREKLADINALPSARRADLRARFNALLDSDEAKAEELISKSTTNK
jgi:hypothetical protein